MPGLMTEIDTARRWCGLSRAELAAAAGISHTALVNMLTTGRVELRGILVVCAVLGLDLHTSPRRPS